MIVDQCGKLTNAFDTIDPARLDAAAEAFLNALPFGVIGLAETGEVEIFNATEERYAGLKRENPLGKPFFLAIGVCMNNYLVAQRYEDEADLDVILDYILTFRMRPTPVKLRLLKQTGLRRRFLLVQRQ